MVKIPDIPVAQRRLETAPAGVAPSIEQASFGGRAIEAVGGIVQEQGELLRESDLKKSKAIANEKLSEFKIQQRAKRREREAAFDGSQEHTKGVLEDFDASYNELLSGVDNADVRDFLATNRGKEKENTAFYAIDFEASTRPKIERSNLEGNINRLSNEVFSNPALLDEVGNDILDMIQGSGINAAEKDEFNLNASADIFESAVLGSLENEDLEGAQDALERGKDVFDDAVFKKLTNNVEKFIEEQKQIIDVDEVFTGEATINPKSPDSQSAVDVWFNRNRESLEGADLIQLAVNSGLIPTEVRDSLVGRLNTGKPEEVVQAAQFISVVGDKNINALPRLTQTEKTRAEEISRLALSGANPTDIISFMNSKKSPEFEFLSQSFIDDDVADFSDIADSFDDVNVLFEIFGEDESEVPQSLKREFENLSKLYYVNNNAAKEDAQSLAVKDIKGRWSPTKIGAARWQKFSPEIMYRNPKLDGTRWINKQLVDDTKDVEGLQHLNREEDIFLEIDKDDIGKSAPAYGIWFRNIDGGIERLTDDDANPINFAPDMEKAVAEFNKKEDIKKKKSLQKAAEKRRLKLKHERFFAEQRAKNDADN